jgi:hypothetical protein
LLGVSPLWQLDQGLLAQLGGPTALDLLHLGQGLLHLVGILQQAIGQIEGLGLPGWILGTSPSGRWYLVL